MNLVNYNRPPQLNKFKKKKKKKVPIERGMELKNGRNWGEKNTSFFAMILSPWTLKKFGEKIWPSRLGTRTAGPDPRPPATAACRSAPLTPTISRARARKEGRKKRERKEEKSFFLSLPAGRCPSRRGRTNRPRG